jgi:hypothetical protein
MHHTRCYRHFLLAAPSSPLPLAHLSTLPPTPPACTLTLRPLARSHHRTTTISIHPTHPTRLSLSSNISKWVSLVTRATSAPPPVPAGPTSASVSFSSSCGKVLSLTDWFLLPAKSSIRNYDEHPPSTPRISCSYPIITPLCLLLCSCRLVMALVLVLVVVPCPTLDMRNSILDPPFAPPQPQEEKVRARPSARHDQARLVEAHPRGPHPWR